MKKYKLIVFILIALFIASLTFSKTSYSRKALIDFFTSDSDSVWTTRGADSWQDSILDIGGCEQGVQAEFWGCFYGDSGKLLLTFNYGHDPANFVAAETLLDTSLATVETLHVVKTVTNWKYSFGSFILADSIDDTAGDSVKLKLIIYEQ